MVSVRPVRFRTFPRKEKVRTSGQQQALSAPSVRSGQEGEWLGCPHLLSAADTADKNEPSVRTPADTLFDPRRSIDVRGSAAAVGRAR